MTAQSYPTLGTVIPAYNYLFDKIEDIMKDKAQSKIIRFAAKKCHTKLRKYYVRNDMSPACALGTGKADSNHYSVSIIFIFTLL